MLLDREAHKHKYLIYLCGLTPACVSPKTKNTNTMKKGKNYRRKKKSSRKRGSLPSYNIASRVGTRL